jgi:hypothetical protein
MSKEKRAVGRPAKEKADKLETLRVSVKVRHVDAVQKLLAMIAKRYR